MIVETLESLGQRMMNDCLLAHLNAVIWLDPFAIEVGSVGRQAIDHDTVYALQVLRTCFQDIYCHAVSDLRSGASWDSICSLVCHETSEYGFALDLSHPESVRFGIPLPAYGSDLLDPYFYQVFPQVPPVLACFRYDTNDDAYDVYFFDEPDDIVHPFMETLTTRNYPEPCKTVLQWLWGWHDNPCISYDEESLWNMEMPEWTPENVQYAREVIQEAEQVWETCLQGLGYIETHPAFLQRLTHDVNTMRNQQER